MPLGRVATLEQTISEMLGPQRFNAVALGLFALIALVVALHGLHAVLARSVEERRSELGLRLALGAHARDVIRLVVGRGLRLTLVGLGLGTLAAVMLGRLLAELLYEIEPSDPATLAGGALLLGLAALASCYLPARRASRVDPMAALRCE